MVRQSTRGEQWPMELSFQTLSSFGAQLVSNPQPLLNSLAKKLLIYGCGRPVSLVDQPSVDYVVDSAKRNGNGLRSMIHAVVESELFNQP